MQHRLPALTGNERLMLVALTATGLALRAQGLGELSLAHFDEGVLMSGAFDTRLAGLWHFTLAQPLQAPPLYPWLVSGLMWLTGIESPLIGAYASVLFGSATIPLLFLLARRIGGNWVGLIAAGLLATSDLHIAFSRMALTEAALTFWFVLAMYAWGRLTDAQTVFGFHGLAVWALAAGLATGACWNTKYNGWMPCAIAITAWCLAGVRQRFVDRDARPLRATARQGAALLCATAIAAGCFVPWYRYVEQSFPGGYAAVTRNHLNYVGGVSEWPGRAARLFTSLSAFRHYGWSISLAALLLGLICYVALNRRASSAGKARAAPLWGTMTIGALAAAAIVVLGSDAFCLLLAAATIVPALAWGRAAEITLAVWVGAFLVLTPFYHPYTRLIVPALPGAICLGLWLCRAAARLPQHVEHEASRTSSRLLPRTRQTATACIVATIVASLAIALTAHPFGWLPTAAQWRRWTTRHSYRAFSDAVRDHTPADAYVLCQGMPIMPLYLERQWDSLGHVPFTAWIDRVPRDRPCYLAIDFWGLYGEHHEAARRAIAEQLANLDAVAWIEDDLNLATLLDYLPPAEVARRISRDWPRRRFRDGQGRTVIVPAEPRDDHANLIVLYRVKARAIEATGSAGPPVPARRRGE